MSLIENNRLQVLEPQPTNALAYLQALYRDPSVDPIVRRRCAIACLPFEVPKLAAYAHIEGGDLKERLERASAQRKVQIPDHRGQSFQSIADSVPVIADSF
jgi:hypothetical protein